MIRKFNYTGRKKIRRSDVRIDLLRDDNNRRYFNISLHLADLELPETARVFVEAYHRSGYQRFDIGTAGKLRIPDYRTLGSISASALPLFRVKVVDKTSSHGRILASVDKVRPASVDDQPVGSRSMLFVEFEDLGHAVWQLDLDGDWPVLKLNLTIDEISLIASSDNRFLSLVYPEVLRQILTRILMVDEHTDPDCDDDWPSLWLKLASSLPGMSAPTQISKAGRLAWIENAVDAFGANFNMLDKFHQAFQNAE
jgi:hypothetical protein